MFDYAFLLVLLSISASNLMVTSIYIRVTQINMYFILKLNLEY